jgi:hypothetical protein
MPKFSFLFRQQLNSPGPFELQRRTYCSSLEPTYSRLLTRHYFAIKDCIEAFNIPFLASTSRPFGPQDSIDALYRAYHILGAKSFFCVPNEVSKKRGVPLCLWFTSFPQLELASHYIDSSYCDISINSAGPVTRYTPAEILVSALWSGHRYIAQKIRQVTAGGPKIWGIQRGTRQSIRHLPKMTVTSVTFRRFERPRYALLPN